MENNFHNEAEYKDIHNISQEFPLIFIKRISYLDILLENIDSLDFN